MTNFYLFLPVTSVTSMRMFSRALLCIRGNHLTTNNSKWAILIENKIVHGFFLKKDPYQIKNIALLCRRKFKTISYFYGDNNISSIAILLILNCCVIKLSFLGLAIKQHVEVDHTVTGSLHVCPGKEILNKTNVSCLFMVV